MSSQNNNLYNNLPNRIDTILGGDQHLHRLKQLSDARSDWIIEQKANPRQPLDTNAFANWLFERWGIELKHHVESGGLSGYEVIDAQKHLLFTMVYP